MISEMATDREITREMIRLKGYGPGEEHTQYQFAKNAGIDPTVLNSVLRGTRKSYGISLKKRIASELKIPFHKFQFLIESDAPLETIEPLLDSIELNDPDLWEIIRSAIEIAKRKKGDDQRAAKVLSLLKQHTKNLKESFFD